MSFIFNQYESFSNAENNTVKKTILFFQDFLLYHHYIKQQIIYSHPSAIIQQAYTYLIFFQFPIDV